MKFYKIKKLTVITEAAILDNVLELATELGADSYTIDRVSGKGEKGVRFGMDSDISGMLTNVRIEIITREELAKKIALEVEANFFQNYAGIVYLQDVEVIQARKFNIKE